MEYTDTPKISRWRTYRALLAVSLAYGVATIAALVTRSGTGHLTRGVESASTASTSLLGGIATALPFGYAFGAGMVAAVNPCGFALLPAFLGLYLGGQTAAGTERSRRQQARQAIQIGAMVTASFVVLFGVTGFVLNAVTSAITGAFPWIGLIVGIALVLFGGIMLSGGALSTNLGGRLAGRLGTHARQTSTRGYLAYGLAYGLASLGCTLPIFLTVVGGTLTVHNLPVALGQFVLYALGMGFVLTVLTLSIAFFKYTVMNGVRRVTRYVHAVSAVLLLVAGVYLIYYWLTLGGLLAGVGVR